MNGLAIRESMARVAKAKIQHPEAAFAMAAIPVTLVHAFLFQQTERMLHPIADRILDRLGVEPARN